MSNQVLLQSIDVARFEETGVFLERGGDVAAGESTLSRGELRGCCKPL